MPILKLVKTVTRDLNLNKQPEFVKGRNIMVNVDISFMESIKGTKKPVLYHKMII